MDEYTPTTDEVLVGYVVHTATAMNPDLPVPVASDAFHRWYAAEKAKWQAEAWDEGVSLLASRHSISVGPDWLRLSNPHRIKRGE